MKTYELFNLNMQALFKQAVSDACEFVTTMCSTEAGLDFETFATMMTPRTLFENSRYMLASSLDPEDANYDVVTPQMEKALKEIICEKVYWSID